MSTQLDMNKTMLTGTDLRVLLNSDHISYGEIHSTLKQKGIFVGNSDKAITVPLLSATLLTPDDFACLIESSISRETRPKVKVLGLTLSNYNADWIGALREKLFEDGFNALKSIGNVDFVDSPDLLIEGKNKIVIPYKIVRKDFSKDWLQRELHFEAEITIERQDNALKLDFSSKHSSLETESINKKIVARITNLLSINGMISSPELEQIKFSSFTNEERIRFFKPLTSGHQQALSNGDVNDIEISKDINSPPLPNDPQVSWMNHSVKRIKVDGDRLNDIFLISEEKYYSYYHILRMDIIHPFNEGANSGKCRVSYTFSPFSRRDSDISNSELVFETISTTYNNTVNPEAKKNILHSVTKSIRALIEKTHQQIIQERTPALETV